MTLWTPESRRPFVRQSQPESSADETGSIILTSNKAFTEWGSLLGGASVVASAILDRLLHHSVVFNIKGESYRLREKRDALVREEVPSR